MEILNQFGVQPVLLAAQVVNFLILLFLLKKFLYKPILKILDERKKRIEQSLKNAEEIEKRLHEIADKEAEAILKSAREGEKIIREAGIQGAQIIEEANKTAEQIILKATNDAKKVVESEREILMQEVRANVAGLVSLVFEKVTGKMLNQKNQKQLVEKAVKELRT